MALNIVEKRNPICPIRNSSLSFSLPFSFPIFVHIASTVFILILLFPKTWKLSERKLTIDGSSSSRPGI